jgi:fatty acid desaturase
MSSKPSDFVERNNFKTFLTLFTDWGAIFLILAFSTWANNIVVYLIAIWTIGFLQLTIGDVLTHEASHYNLFQQKSWNDHLEFLYAYPCFLTVDVYRYYHLQHHKYVGKEGDYLVKDYKFFGLDRANNNLFFLLFLKPILGFSICYYLYELFRQLPHLNWRTLKNGFRLLSFWIVVIVAFYLSGHIDILLLYWFIPYVWCFHSYLYWSEVEEHYNTQSGIRSKLNPLSNFLTHNRGYHHIHHWYPSIPWYKLPEAHQALFPSDITDISYGLLDTYKQLEGTGNGGSGAKG